MGWVDLGQLRRRAPQSRKVRGPVSWWLQSFSSPESKRLHNGAILNREVLRVNAQLVNRESSGKFLEVGRLEAQVNRAGGPLLRPSFQQHSPNVRRRLPLQQLGGGPVSRGVLEAGFPALDPWVSANSLSPPSRHCLRRSFLFSHSMAQRCRDFSSQIHRTPHHRHPTPRARQSRLTCSKAAVRLSPETTSAPQESAPESAL